MNFIKGFRAMFAIGRQYLQGKSICKIVVIGYVTPSKKIRKTLYAKPLVFQFGISSNTRDVTNCCVTG